MVVEQKTITLIAVQDVYKRGEEEGEEELVLVKADVETRYTCCTENIKSIREIATKEGDIEKHYCRIRHEHDGEIDVMGSYDEVVKIIFGKVKQPKIGFSKQKDNDDDK